MPEELPGPELELELEDPPGPELELEDPPGPELELELEPELLTSEAFTPFAFWQTPSALKV